MLIFRVLALQRQENLNALTRKATTCFVVGHRRCAQPATYPRLIHAIDYRSPNRNSVTHHLVQSYRTSRPQSKTVIVRSMVSTASTLQSISLSTAASIAVLGAAALMLLNGWKLSHKPEVHGASTPFWQEVLARCPTVNTEYHVQPLLANRHVETIVASKLRRNPGVQYIRETLTMADGGTVTVDYEDSNPAKDLPLRAPVIIILPGLTGGSHDVYIQHMVINARKAGFRAVVFNSRGTSDSPVTTAQFYSASFTGDMRAVVQHVAQKFPDSVLTAIGYSLGGNILVRYLGEQGADTPIQAAVSLCNPLNLPIADRNWRSGFNKIYDLNLANSLRGLAGPHLHMFEAQGDKYDVEGARTAKSIRAFDEAITRRSFGWPSVDAYYDGSSSSRSIAYVSIPLLLVQADNDPIAPREGIPFDAIAANPKTALVVTPTGGHLGWMAGKDGPLGAPWTDDVVTEFFTSVFSIKYELQPLQQSASLSAAKQ